MALSFSGAADRELWSTQAIIFAERCFSDAAPGGARLTPACPRAFLIDDLAQQIVFRPGQEFDFGDQLGPHPMHAA